MEMKLPLFTKVLMYQVQIIIYKRDIIISIVVTIGAKTVKTRGILAMKNKI